MAAIKFLLVPVIITCTASSRAQDINGAIAGQIAALKVYITSAERGYEIARDGIHAARDIKNGEFGLHKLYFESLQKVNPMVKTQLESITIASELSQAPGRWRRSGLLSADELDAAQDLLGHYKDQIQATLEAVTAAFDTRPPQANDGDRIFLRDRLTDHVKMLNRDARRFISMIDILIANRQREFLTIRH